MTEIEAKNELFKIHQEYMKHSPKERLKLYNEYLHLMAVQHNDCSSNSILISGGLCFT